MRALTLPSSFRFYMIFKCFFAFFCAVLLVACGDLSYLWHAGQGHLTLMNKRIPLDKALNSKNLNPKAKQKLLLVPEIKDFAKNRLKMDIDDDIYTSYIDLGRPYVSWLLRVSLAYELKPYFWSFPVVGRVPYKGFFKKQRALSEARSFSKEQYDTYVRGVSAYSTLGWFEDAVLSSMMSYSDTDFVVIMFHELAHTVLFFEDHIDFNERFAEFIGRKAAILFFLEREGEDSPSVQKLKAQWEDELVFSSFMAREYESLNSWYKENKGHITPQQKKERIQALQTQFTEEIQPLLKSTRYDYFPRTQLNNAILLSYRSYNYNMEEFEKLFNSSKINQSISGFIEHCSQFEDDKNPEEAFRRAVSAL